MNDCPMTDCPECKKNKEDLGLPTQDEGRDNSIDAIMRRYQKANEQAIVMHDRIAFDSIRDVYYLVQLVKKTRGEK